MLRLFGRQLLPWEVFELRVEFGSCLVVPLNVVGIGAREGFRSVPVGVAEYTELPAGEVQLAQLQSHSGVLGGGDVGAPCALATDPEKVQDGDGSDEEAPSRPTRPTDTTFAKMPGDRLDVVVALSAGMAGLRARGRRTPCTSCFLTAPNRRRGTGPFGRIAIYLRALP